MQIHRPKIMFSNHRTFECDSYKKAIFRARKSPKALLMSFFQFRRWAIIRQIEESKKVLTSLRTLSRAAGSKYMRKLRRQAVEKVLKVSMDTYEYLTDKQVQRLGWGDNRRCLGKKQIVNHARRRLARGKRTVNYAQREADAWGQLQEILQNGSNDTLTEWFENEVE